jgi:hypothetical protein
MVAVKGTVSNHKNKEKIYMEAFISCSFAITPQHGILNTWKKKKKGYFTSF